MNPELLVVMPVCNEQASVRKVVIEWFQEIENWTEDFVFLAINDGSEDETEKVLLRLREQFGERLELISRENRGHGQTCLEGYGEAVKRGIPWILQIDSDGQCDPQYFFQFWRKRDSYDVIYGIRIQRDDGWRRVLASWVLRFTLLFFARVWCEDANVPYRLMRSRSVGAKTNKIPRGFFLSNIGLAVLLKRDKSIRHGTVPIRFRERYGGEPSVRLAKFGSKATELIANLKCLKE
ncbi:MAG: glycosyltransferase family 2 protein [Verrucomicrobiae bacterium]